MQTSDVIKDVWAREIIRQLYKTEDGKSYDDFYKDASQLVPSVVSFVSSQFDFGFNVNESEQTITIDQVDYTLKGANNDCRDVINIRYGSGTDNDSLLEEVTALKLDRDRSTAGGS